MARLQLEKEHIKKEVAHEAERLKLETGLRQEDATEETDLVSQHKKYLADKNGLVDKLKNQGESFLKDK
ncbi:25368_t:CDS:1, partial [Gigaspora margarita]